MTALLFLVTAFIWGTTFYAITLQLGVVSPYQSVFYRFLLAALIMWFIVLIGKRRIRFSRDTHLLFASLGFCLFSLNYILIYLGTQYLVSGLISVIFSLMIVINTLVYWLYFRKRPSLAFITGATIGIAGITALFAEEFWTTQLDTALVLGLSFTLMSALMASAGNIIARLLQLRKVDVTSSNTWSMTYGVLFILIAVFIEGEPWSFSLHFDYLLSLLYLSLAGTVIAFWTYITLIERIGAPRAAYITVVFPLVALLISTLFEDMHWTLLKLTGVVLIIGGNLFIVQRKQRS